MKLLSVAKTIVTIRDGFPAGETLGAVASFAGTLFDGPKRSPDLVRAINDRGHQVSANEVDEELRRLFARFAQGERYDIRDGRLYKNVTRRGGWSKKRGEPAVWKPGWPNAKVGDVVELIEWSSRVGPRWVCHCGWLGTTKSFRGGDGVDRYPNESPWHLASECPMDGRASVEYRSPRRLGLRRFAEVDLVRLGDITPEDVIREGFPGWTPEKFVDFYCSGKPEPDRMVTRLVLEVVS